MRMIDLKLVQDYHKIIKRALKSTDVKSMERLSERSGVTMHKVRQMCAGEADPGIESLIAVLNTLGLDLSAVLENKISRDIDPDLTVSDQFKALRLIFSQSVREQLAK